MRRHFKVDIYEGDALALLRLLDLQMYDAPEEDKDRLMRVRRRTARALDEHRARRARAEGVADASQS